MKWKFHVAIKVGYMRIVFPAKSSLLSNNIPEVF